DRLKREDEPLPEIREIQPEELPSEDLSAALPELTESVRLTPEVSEPQNLFAAAAAPVFAEAPELDAAESNMSFELAENTASQAVKDQLNAAAKISSTKQPKIYIDEGDNRMDGLEADELVKEMTDNLGGSTAEKIRGRFDSLDDLLGRGKSMPENAEILIPTELLFELGSWTLKEEAKLSLMKLGMLIMANPNSTYIFKGFTDSIPFSPNVNRPGPKNNQQLSEARARSVRDWLVLALDLQNYKLEVRGYGSANPLVQPTGNVDIDKDIEAINRRVEVEILK
ncbi:MAG: OmpA family protein, partial [Verrucomicrobiota bacterium]